MARRFFIGSLPLLAAFALGCQPNGGMVDNLPAPTFNGPRIAAPVAVALPPAPSLPDPVAPPIKGISPKALALGERSWIPNAPARAWKWIVIHHSASPSGNAAVFDREHREKGWDELGYHFVIGNGTESGNGQVEVGPRWPKQKWGAHAKTPDNRFNDYGIGICLVGNFDLDRPTAAQMQSVTKLVAYLQATYHIPAENVVGHGTVHIIAHGGTATDCPGRNMNVALIRKAAAQRLAEIAAPADDTSAKIAAATEAPGDDDIDASNATQVSSVSSTGD